MVLYTLSLFCDDSKDKKKGSHPYLLSSDWHTENGVEKKPESNIDILGERALNQNASVLDKILLKSDKIGLCVFKIFIRSYLEYSFVIFVEKFLRKIV